MKFFEKFGFGPEEKEAKDYKMTEEEMEMDQSSKNTEDEKVDNIKEPYNPEGGEDAIEIPKEESGEELEK